MEAVAKPLHPNTLAAHLRRKGFARAAFDGHWISGGFRVSVAMIDVAQHGTVRTIRGVWLSFRDPDDWPAGVRYDRRAELERMIAALAPDFEVAEDLGSRVVVVRQKGAES